MNQQNQDIENRPPNEEWDQVISPKRSWFDLNLSELWRYRDLITLFVRRDFVAGYKQTVLGPLWHFIQPLMTTVVFTIVFGRIAQISTDGQPQFLFYMCGVTIWNYFAGCLNGTSSTFVANASIFGKVYFPRLTVPVSIVISRLIAFSIQMLMFLGFYAYYYLNGAALNLSLWVLAIPLFLIIMALLGLGLGIIISSMTTKYRDLAMLVSFGVQLFMYASPVIYPLSTLSEEYRFYLSFNPVAPILEGFRYAFFSTGIFDLHMLLYSVFVTVFIFLFGVALFHRVEKTFMDTV